MKGQKWLGVKFDDSTQPDVVYRLFDRAVYSGEERGYTIVLDKAPIKHTILFIRIPRCLLSGHRFL